MCEMCMWKKVHIISHLLIETDKNRVESWTGCFCLAGVCEMRNEWYDVGKVTLEM